MRVINFMLALFLFFILLCPVDLYSQPLQTGQAVATFCNQSSYSVKVIDTRVRPPFTAPYIGNNWWGAPFFSNTTWQFSNLGTIFGIAIDKSKNIFVTSTAIYNLGPSFGSAGAGGVYVLDDATWNATTFLGTLNAPAWNSDPTKIANTGPSLGNIAYDKYNDQLFCTNFEDGKIYRIKIIPSGTTVIGSIVETFDPVPSNNNDDSTGYAPLGDRVWGIGVTKDPISNIVKVYYSVWVENSGFPNPTDFNRIGRVDLNASGSVNVSSNNNSLIQIPSLTSSNYSNPVSDLEFSLDNRKMIAAERTMFNDSSTSAHQSRVIEYKLDNAGNWIQEPAGKFLVGELTPFLNSAGGVDYQYFYPDTLNSQIQYCDSIVWMSGDALRFVTNNFVYGLQGTIASGGNFASSLLIDLDQELSGQDKTIIGDVDILRDYNCYAPADTACMTILRDTIYCDSTGNGYYYTFFVRNNSATKSITELEFTVDAPLPPNTVFVNPSYIVPNPPIPPLGTSQYTVHLTGPGVDTCEQFVCYTLSATLDYVDCPTCCYVENCIKLPCCESCGEVSNDSIYCVNGQYYFAFTLTNQSGFTVNKIQLTSPMVNGLVFVPSNITGLTLLDGQSISQTVQVLNGTAGQTYPVRFKLFWGAVECCYFEKNYTLPPCGSDTCRCRDWQYMQYQIGKDTTRHNLMCDSTYVLQSGSSFNLIGNMLCNPNDTLLCRDSYEIISRNLTNNNTVITNQVGVLNYSLTVDDNYQITLKSFCGGRLCDTCQFIIKRGGSPTRNGRQAELLQNYPNPFNPVTQISFYLPSDAKVSVKVYNITGQEVAALINNELNTAGLHSVIFDGSNVASGIYFYKLETDNFTETKKMLIVK